MRLVVTGALGHIGSQLIRDLAVQYPGTEIVMIDNLSTQRYASLFKLPEPGRYSFMEADVRSLDLATIFAGARAVVHLAAMTDAASSVEKGAELEANNLGATKAVCDACVRSGTPLLWPSSTSVYGSQNSLVAEDCPAEELQPQSPYATTKLKEEELIRRYVAQHDLRAVICRFGTIFGTSVGMRFHTAVNKFCWQAAMGQPITVWRTAYDQKRPYLDLTDAIRAMSFIVENQVFDGRIYNVLTLNATVRHIVETIRDFVPALDVSFVDSRIMNQLSYEVSCERFVQLGFRFQGDLRRGVGDTIALLHGASGSRRGRD